MTRWPEVKIEKEVIIKCLEKNKFLILTTAEELGISRGILKRLIKEFSIPVPKIPLGKSFKDLSNTHISNPKYPKAKSTYDGMKKRCYNPKEKCYKDYGGRGIKVCDRWLESFDNFFEDCLVLDNAFNKGYSIDRKDVNGHYEISNIHFVTHKEQCNNRRYHHLIEYNGEVKTLSAWAETYGLTYDFLKDRIKLGFTFEEAVTIPKGVTRRRYYSRSY